MPQPSCHCALLHVFQNAPVTCALHVFRNALFVAFAPRLNRSRAARFHSGYERHTLLYARLKRTHGSRRILSNDCGACCRAATADSTSRQQDALTACARKSIEITPSVAPTLKHYPRNKQERDITRARRRLHIRPRQASARRTRAPGSPPVACGRCRSCPSRSWRLCAPGWSTCCHRSHWSA